MKKNVICYALALVLAIVVASCSKSKDSVIHVDDALSEYGEDSLSRNYLYDLVRVEEGDYTLTKEAMGYSLTLKLNNRSGSFEDDEENKAKAAVLSKCKIVVTLVDKDETEIEGGELMLSGATLKDILDWCNSSDFNSKKEYKFLLPMGNEEIVGKAAGIKVFAKTEGSAVQYTSTAGDDEGEPADDADEVEDSDETASAGGNFDEFLDSYEEYIDEYVSLMKKVAKGDMDAIAEYPAVLQKAQKLGEQMTNSMDDLTPSQLARYNKLHQKLLKAAQEMQ